MSSFKVSIIRQGRGDDFYDFWDRDKKVNAAGEKLHSDLVGFTVTITASNLNEAISKAKKLHPGLEICVQYSAEIG